MAGWWCSAEAVKAAGEVTLNVLQDGTRTNV